MYFACRLRFFFEHVSGSKKQQDHHLLAEKINMALEKLPEAGRFFVLDVAQNYARYHVSKPKAARKKD